MLEIPRDITDAQPALRIPVIAQRLESRRIKCFQPPAEIRMPRKQAIDRNIVLAVQREHFGRLEIESIRKEAPLGAEPPGAVEPSAST